jgi:mRNA interferase RelE/StbE
VSTGSRDRAYDVQVEKQALKSLADIPTGDRERIVTAIDGLRGNPRPHGVEKLSAKDGLYRIRAGNYRVVYQIRDKELIVLVIKIADRKDVYRRLRRRKR